MLDETCISFVVYSGSTNIHDTTRNIPYVTPPKTTETEVARVLLNLCRILHVGCFLNYQRLRLDSRKICKKFSRIIYYTEEKNRSKAPIPLAPYPTDPLCGYQCVDTSVLETKLALTGHMGGEVRRYFCHSLPLYIFNNILKTPTENITKSSSFL